MAAACLGVALLTGPAPVRADPEEGNNPEARARVEPFGRLRMRADLERHEQAEVDRRDERVLGRRDSLDLSVPQARLGLRYRAPLVWLRAEVEVDAAEDFTLKDAWVQARDAGFSVRAGQFKMPFSAFELESSVDLPLARRGLVSDLLTEELEVAGRRPGVAFGFRERGDVRASIVAGAFQGSVLEFEDETDRDVALANEVALDAQSLVARAELKLGDLALGANYEHRVGTDVVREPRHYWTAGADAAFDTEFGANGLRIWAEWIQGASYFEHELKPRDAFDAVFVSLRLVTAFRLGGTRREDPYVEPYGMIAVLDPDTDVAADGVLEETLGVNVGLWRLARVGLELERQRVQPNFPARYLLGENAHRMAAVLSAQVAF